MVSDKPSLDENVIKMKSKQLTESIMDCLLNLKSTTALSNYEYSIIAIVGTMIAAAKVYAVIHLPGDRSFELSMQKGLMLFEDVLKKEIIQMQNIANKNDINNE